MQRLLYIGFAGLLGTLARFGLSGVIARRFGETFPAGTLVVNVIGCFLAGALAYLLQERFVVSPEIRIATMIGFSRRLYNIFVLRITDLHFTPGWAVLSGCNECCYFKRTRLVHRVGGLCACQTTMR